MKLFPEKGLVFRLLSASILIIVTMLTVYTLFAVFSEERRVRKELTNKGELLTNLLAYSSRTGVFAENRDLLKDVAAGVAAEPDVVLVEIYNADMKQLYVISKSSANTDFNREPGTPDEVIKTELATPTQATDRTLEFMKPVVLTIYPNEEKVLYFGDQEPGTNTRVIGHVRIVLGKEALDREILCMLKRNAIIAFIFICASAFVVYLGVKKITHPLEALTENVRVMGQGGIVTQVPVTGTDEVGKLATAFNTMLDERRAAQQAFQKILMDIHDGIGGITTNICMLTEVALKASSQEDISKSLNTILELSREGMGEIRSLMYSLDRNDLNWHTLIAELRNRGTKTVEHHAIAFDLKAEIDESVTRPGSLLCLHLFRIYREALTNVIKHSKAKNVTVGFQVNKERISLTIRDNGLGYDHAAHSGKGRGVSNMKVRAAEIGGTVMFTSDAGTCVSVNIPLPLLSRPDGPDTPS